MIRVALRHSPLAAALAKAITTPFTATTPIARLNRFAFSAVETASKVEAQSKLSMGGQDRAATFYRNSIRRINTNDSGRGKFTEHHLLRLIKLTDTVQQEPLLFEAYYNYIGHFTVISSTTVDKMITKSLGFEGCSLGRVIQIFQNHNYLSYFPHYNVTSRLLQLAKNEQQHYLTLLNIFISSPLIKFNADIVNLLIQELRDPSTNSTAFSLIAKLLTQRQHFQLLEGIISRRDLLSRIVEGLQGRLDNQTFKVLRKSQGIKNWCKEIVATETIDDALQYQVAILAVTVRLDTVFADSLIKVKDQDKVARCLLYLKQTPPSFQASVVNYLSDRNISQQLRARLQEFKPPASPPPQPIQAQAQ